MCNSSMYGFELIVMKWERTKESNSVYTSNISDLHNKPYSNMQYMHCRPIQFMWPGDQLHPQTFRFPFFVLCLPSLF